jgi:hypothetical protein
VVRWGYTREGTAFVITGGGLPPETGTDEVVVRGGRIVAYTRTPDPAALQARRQALDRANERIAARASADGGPAAEPHAPAPPGAGRWLLAVGLVLASVVLLALATRRPDPEARP